MNALVYVKCRHLTILKVTGKISVVIYSLLFLDNRLLFWKIFKFLLVILTNDWLFSDIASWYLKITSCRWLKENNRLIFPITGIDNQGKKQNKKHFIELKPLILMSNGAKLAVAPVARATPLFLPRPEIIYIYVLHFSAPPLTYFVRAIPPLSPDWRHCWWVRCCCIIFSFLEDCVRPIAGNRTLVGLW